MPRFYTKPLPFSAPKKLSFNWPNFAGGLNTLFKEQEIKSSELAQAQNIMLVGQGVPTKRWGTAVYNLAGEQGSVRALKGFFPSGASGTNQLLSITDDGFLTAKSGASYSTFTGVSWASGYNVEMAQLDNKMYIVNGQRELARFSNPTLIGFPTIGQPSSIFATGISGATGSNTLSYMLTHTSSVGETAPTTPFTLANQPLDLVDGTVRLQWANASTASGVRTGTNIYGRTLGYETFLARVDAQATRYDDDGGSQPQLFAFPPLADSTGGPNPKFIKRFQDRLIFSGFPSDPTLLLISGRVPNQEKFDFGSGGGFVRIEPNSGDSITAIETTENKIIVFKESSIWNVTLETQQIGNFFLIEPVYTQVTSSVGAASQRAVVHVENDILFLAKGGKGIYVVGYEPNITSGTLRTNEVSTKVRPYFQNITPSQETMASATYKDYKFIVTFPGRQESMVFDRERNAWTGPWTVDGSVFEVYKDSSDQLHLLMGDDTTTNVLEFSASYPGDRGVAFSTILRTKREDMGDWTRFKNIENIFTRWRNVLGSVSVSIREERRNGQTVSASSFSVTPASGNSGFGSDQWGASEWGDTTEDGEARDLNEIVKQALLNDTARNVQLNIQTSNLNDNYELLGVKGEAQDVGDFRPSSWRN